MRSLRERLPLTRAESELVFASVADSVYANLYATVVTGLIDAVAGLIDAVTGALLFWYLGLPGAFMWGAVMFILSILPIVGAGLVWFPVAMSTLRRGSLRPPARLPLRVPAAAVEVEREVGGGIAAQKETEEIMPLCHFGKIPLDRRHSPLLRFME